MSHRLFALPALLLAAALAAPVSPAFAQDMAPQAAAPAPSTPLMTIRFNQKNLYLDKAVYNAVSKAKAEKPDVVFSVEQRPALQGGDTASLGKVVNALRSAGVADAQIRASSGQTSGQPYDVVLVFVQ